MATKARYLLEGKWIGYRSSQDRVVHREIITNLELVEWVQNTYCISYTDGTTLQLSARLLEKGERVKEPMRDGYGSLIRDCFRHKVNSVQKLIDLRKEVN
jgi:hypothetical protein